MILGRSTTSQGVQLFTAKHTHPAINCSLFGDKVFCAWSHCSGSCGLPALTIKINDGGTMKAAGEGVAVGRAWLPIKLYWTGETVMVDGSINHNELYEKVWWL